MKICFDVNVIINLYARSKQLADAVFAYDVANMRKFDVFVPASALADIAYILHRRGLSAAQVDKSIDALFEMFDILDVNGADGLNAHRNGMRDFEDAIIAEACARNGVDLIITHNTRDFRKSPVAAMTPGQFVSAYKPESYDYGEVLA